MGEIFKREVPSSQLEFSGERLTSAVGGQIEIEHLHRYFLAREYCRCKHVLDIASGEGYGAAYLAQVAQTVVGVDLDQQSVEHANLSYARANLRYLEGSATSIPLEASSVDIVVSFETIEHFAEQELFLKEVRRVLKPGGLFICSTPDRDVYSPTDVPANPFHVLELTKAEYAELLKKHFKHSVVMN